VLPAQYEMAKKVIEKYDYSWIRKPWGKSSGRGIEVMDKSKILKKESNYIISR
jgi:phosphoribosylamine-glycine ligase